MVNKWNNEVRQAVKTFQASDYDIDDETPEYVLMKKRTSTGLGHLLVFLFTFWWTFGIGNLIYYFASVKKRKIMK